MRYFYNDYYTPAKPKKVKDGIKAKSQRGSFGEKWWSKNWISVLESFGWSNRLQRGRSYARMGQVVDLNIEKGKVTSHVQGTRPKPYKVEIEMKRIPDKDWEKAADIMAEQAIFAAKLLAGEMPMDIENAFKTAKVSLFPEKRDLSTNCSCPDSANPCKHIAAVYYILGERFDEDPFFIFLLRGRSKEELMETLRKRRAASVQETEKEKPEAVKTEAREEPPELVVGSSFWDLKKPLDEFRIEIDRPEVKAAAVKRLGEPSFWKSQKQFAKALEKTYIAASDSVRTITR